MDLYHLINVCKHLMKFKITSIQVIDNKCCVNYYDNQTNELWSEKHIPLCLKFDPRFETVHLSFDKEKIRRFNGKKSKKLKLLKINIDNDIITPWVNTLPLGATFIEKQINNLICKIQKFSIDIQTIKLFLEYKDENIEYYNCLLKNIRNSNKNSTIEIYICGILPKESLYSYISKYKIAINFYMSNLMFENTSSQRIELLKRFANNSKNAGVRVSVILDRFGGEAALNNICKDINAKIGKDIVFKFGPNFVLCDSISENNFNWTNKNAVEFVRQVVNLNVSKQKPELIVSENQMINRIIKRLVEKQDMKELPYLCESSLEDVLVVDVNGNQIFCCKNDKKYLKQFNIINVSNINIDTINKWSNHENCKNCPFLVSCLGGCVIRDQYIKNNCQTLFFWHMAIFYSAWYLMFGTVIQEIIAVDN